MNISYYFKNLDTSDAIKEYASKKIEKLRDRLHHVEGIDIRFSLERQLQIFEITIRADATVFHLKKSDKDLYAAIDNALDILGVQIDKYRKKLEEKTSVAREQLLPQTETRTYAEEAFIPVYEADAKPMDDLEAIMQMRAGRYKFMMYRHDDTKRYGLVSARPDGNYSIITPAVEVGQYTETVVKLKKNVLTKVSESLYPVSRLTMAEALDDIEDNHLDYLAFVNDENTRLNILFHAKNGGLAIKRPSV